MSTICRDCEAIVVADDDVPADLVRIAMANHERFCKPGRREICDICDDVDFITSSGETNIQAVLARLTDSGAIRDDAQIAVLRACKRWSTTPGVRITLQPIDQADDMRAAS